MIIGRAGCRVVEARSGREAASRSRRPPGLSPAIRRGCLPSRPSTYRAPARELQERGDRRQPERGNRRQHERVNRHRLSRSRRRPDRRSRSAKRSDKGRRERRASPPPAKPGSGGRVNETSWVHTDDAAGKAICKNFSRGVCKAKECKRSHRCAICLSAAHGANEH